MATRIGTCSLCGGDVMDVDSGKWFSTGPLPPPTCRACGAVTAASQRDTIPMVPVLPRPPLIGRIPDPWLDPFHRWPWDQSTCKVTCR